LVAQPQGSFRLGETEQQTETVLRANPKLSAIVSIGITQTRGTTFALRSFGRQNNVAPIAFDQDLDLMYSLRHGDIDAIVAQVLFWSLATISTIPVFSRCSPWIGDLGTP
jgi:ABC-type sugar transport system substrate-binding protein